MEAVPCTSPLPLPSSSPTPDDNPTSSPSPLPIPDDNPTPPPPPPDSQISSASSLMYWNSVDADVNGMLGGFPNVSLVDLQGSRTFLARLNIGKKANQRVKKAVDCGAGIGRITEGLLLSVAERVDVVEPVAKFTEGLVKRGELEGLGKVVNVGLESWDPRGKVEGKEGNGEHDGTVEDDDEEGYDLIWNQWCLGHLTDDQLTEYLKRCRDGLRKGGVVVVKENLVLSGGPWGEGQDQYDDTDSSVTRSDVKFRQIFENAGLKLVRTDLQKGFPPELYPVRMYALKPAAN